MPNRRPFLAAVLALAAAAAHAQPPVVSPFTLLPGDLDGGAAGSHQQFPASALGDGQTLVVWYDHVEIHAARLDADGDVIDISPIVVARDRTINASLPRPQAPPASVAWNGEHWLIAFPGHTTSLSGFYTTTYIFGVRIAPDGTVVDQTPITIRRSEDINPESNLEPYGSAAAAGPDGNWAVAWTEYDTAAARYVVRGHLVSAGGAVITPSPVILMNTPSSIASRPDMAGTDDGYLLAAISGSSAAPDAYARRFSPALVPTTAPMLLGAGDARTHADVDVAAGPSEILVAAQAGDSGIYGFRLARSGTGGPINPAGIPLVPAAGAYGAAPDGANWALAYVIDAGTATDLRFRRFLPSLAPADPAPLPVPLHPEYVQTQFYRSAAVAELSAGGVEILWHDNAVPADDNVWGSRVPTGAVPQVRELISAEIPTQAPGGLATAADGSGVAVFYSFTAEARHIHAQRFGPSGAIIDPQPITVATYTFPQNAGAPSVAFNGSIYMIVWPSGSRVWARRMTPGGAFLDPDPVPVLPLNSTSVVTMLGADVAAIGDTFLVASESAESFNRPYVRFTRVRGSDMAVLDPDGPVLEFNISQLGDFSTPVVEPVGSPGAEVFLVAFTDYPRAGPSNIDLVFIAPDGTRQHASAVGADGAALPAVAAIGDRALVAWRNTGPDGADIFGRFFNSSGIAEGPEFLILSAPGTQTSPRLTADDDNFLLAFSDFRHLAGGNPLDPSFSDPWAARLDASGNSLDGAGFPLRVTPPSSELDIRLATLGPDRYIAMYSGLTPEAPTVFRAGTQIISEGGGGCPADWNGDGAVNSTDISAFLTTWLASIQGGTLDADFNTDGAVNSSDISAFLTGWLQAVQTGC